MRLLVVEDEPKVASFIKRGLEEAGHVVDVAYTGCDGEYLAAINFYDVMLLDCLLPDKDGRQVCRDLRARGRTVPALMVTAKDTTADKIIGFDSGADQYLTKPFDFGELLSRIRALGRHAQSMPVCQLAVANLTLDPLSRQARRDHKTISLTNKEYLLLELLVRRAGQIITRTEIIEQVWDLHHDPTTNTVDVLVKNLRDKIDREFEPKLIKTVRGVGYTISPD